MENKLVLQGKLEIKNAHIVIDGIDLANVLEHGSSVFMVVEPLPESKPETKNCGNCSTQIKDEHVCGVCGGKMGQEPMLWSCQPNMQPKAAEPQGWEQRFDKEFPKGLQGYDKELADMGEDCPHFPVTEKVKAFIRAEIERVHAGYAPLICAIEMAFKEADFLTDGRLTRQARAVFEPIRQAEQNRRRSEK